MIVFSASIPPNCIEGESPIHKVFAAFLEVRKPSQSFPLSVPSSCQRPRNPATKRGVCYVYPRTGARPTTTKKTFKEPRLGSVLPCASRRLPRKRHLQTTRDLWDGEVSRRQISREKQIQDHPEAAAAAVPKPSRGTEASPWIHPDVPGSSYGEF